MNWFVLRVSVKRESYIKEFIEEKAKEPIQILLFMKEIIHTKGKRRKKILRPLFPGYLFIHRKVQDALNIINSKLKTEFIQSICFKSIKCDTCFQVSSPCMVRPEEMALLLNSANTYGTFKMSYGFRVKDQVIITRGPLQNLNANLIWINDKKKKACVEIKLFKRKMNITLGIDLIKEIYVTSTQEFSYSK